MKGKAPELIEDFRWSTQPGSGISPWLWAAAVCLVLLIGAGAYILRRRRKGKAIFFRSAAPHEIALKALKELGHLNPDCGLEFIIKVSGILRVYLQDRFGLRAPHRSTEEFLVEASGSGALSAEHQILLGGFLFRCDLVKFAKRSVVAEEMENLLASAREFVEATIPQEEDAPPVTPAAAEEPATISER